jgi:hypothetical protein
MRRILFLKTFGLKFAKRERLKSILADQAVKVYLEDHRYFSKTASWRNCYSHGTYTTTMEGFLSKLLQRSVDQC